MRRVGRVVISITTLCSGSIQPGRPGILPGQKISGPWPGPILFTLFFTNYYAGVGFGTVLWQVVLMFITVIGAGLAVLYAYIQAKQSRPG